MADFRDRDTEVEAMLGRVVGRIDAGPVIPAGQSARDELREALGDQPMAYGYVIVRRYLMPPLMATGDGNEAVRRMLDTPELRRIPAGSPGVDGCLVREDRTAFWVRRVLPDLTCRWVLIEVPKALDVLRGGDCRCAMAEPQALHRALVAWGLVPPRAA